MPDEPPIDYATGTNQRLPFWWTPWVAAAIGAFGLLWMSVGWGSVFLAEPRKAQASGVLLGMLTLAILPGAAVGIFLSVVALQRVGGSIAWIALGLNLTNLAAGLAGIVWSFF
ncbi:MAG: hypothetical protein AAGD32_08250 [Planctomycetota bacterium]